MKITLTVSSKGQITLPKEARDKLGFRPGSKLRVLLSSDKLSLQKEPTIEDYFGDYDGYWSNQGLDPVSIIRELRDKDS